MEAACCGNKSSYSWENHVSSLIHRVSHIADLRDLISKYKWLFLVSNLFKIYCGEPIHVFRDTFSALNPTTFENWHLKIRIGQLPYLLYLSIVRSLMQIVV